MGVAHFSSLRAGCNFGHRHMASRKGGKRTGVSAGKSRKSPKAKKPVRKPAGKSAKKALKPAKTPARAAAKPAPLRNVRAPKTFVRRGTASALRPAPRLKPVIGRRNPYDTDLDRNPANYQALTPLTFLGGAFYSIDMLPQPWRTVSLFNPVVYLVSGFRWSFYGLGDVGVEKSLIFTILFIGLCLGLLVWIFRTGYRLKP